MAASDHLQPMQFSGGGRNYVIESDPLAYRTVTATPVGNKRPVGRLQWYSDSVDDGMANKISGVFVDPRHRRRGLASAMLEHARQINPNVQHHSALSEEGRAWSEARP